MLRTRLIPTLLLKNGVLVRSRNFSLHQSTGNYIYQVKRFAEWKADEIIYLDISREINHNLSIGRNVIGSSSSGATADEDSIVNIINKIS